MSAMIFIENKYSKVYFNIVANAQARKITFGYTEKHHIIPKSLGGTNSKSNLVILTAREHFICHMLLPKITSNNDRYKMIHAAIGMKRRRSYQERYINSRLYESVKKEYAAISSARNKGKAIPNETRAKMSAASKGKAKTKEHAENISKATKGKAKPPMPDSVKKQISEKLKGRPSHRKGKTGEYKHSEEAKQKIIESNRKRIYSEETKAKLSAAAKANAKSRLETRRANKSAISTKLVLVI